VVTKAYVRNYKGKFADFVAVQASFADGVAAAFSLPPGSCAPFDVTDESWGIALTLHIYTKTKVTTDHAD
jgi:hypothetical protein